MNEEQPSQNAVPGTERAVLWQGKYLSLWSEFIKVLVFLRSELLNSNYTLTDDNLYSVLLVLNYKVDRVDFVPLHFKGITIFKCLHV